MIIVAGTARIPPENLARWRDAAKVVIAATRMEAGCRVYSFAEDIVEPGLVRIFEIWETRAALDAHGATPHIAVWRSVLAEIAAFDRELKTYEAAEGKPL